MAQLSNRLQRLAPSATLAMSQKSSEMKAQGIDVINMSVGEPDFNTPDHIKQEAKLAIDENYSRYSPVPGYPDLRQAIARKLERENHLHYTPAEILVSNGAKQSVCNTVMALVNDGEEVIIPAPYWVSYPQMVLLAGGNPVIVEAGFEQNFKMTAEQLEAAITPKTRMLSFVLRATRQVVSIPRKNFSLWLRSFCAMMTCLCWPMRSMSISTTSASMRVLPSSQA